MAGSLQTTDINRHYDWIDSVRGLGVICVVIGHLWYNASTPVICTAIYSFHIPLFFILSGLLVKPINSHQYLKTIKKLFCRLIVPSVIFTALFLPMYFFYEDITLNNLFSELIRTFFYVDGEIAYNKPVWFFVIMFEVKLIDMFVNSCRFRSSRKLIFAAALFLIGYILYRFDFSLPFGINRAIIMYGFMLIGMLLKGPLLRTTRINVVQFVAVLIFLAIWIATGVVFNDKVSYYSFELQKYWLTIIAGIAGTVVFICIGRLIDKKTAVFRFLGNNSVFIICSHYPLVRVIRAFAELICFSETIFFDIVAIIFTIVLLILYVPACKFVNENLPILNGKIK